MLGNSTWGLLLYYKWLLYKICLKELRKMQWRAAISIIGAFCTLLTWGIKAISSLIPIHLHLQKISRRYWLQTTSLLLNHVINLVLENRYTKNSLSHCLFLENITIKQWQKIKSSIVDTNNCLSKVLPLFDSLNYEFSPGFRLIDIFSSYFPFHEPNYKYKESKEAYFCNLDKIFKTL